MFFCEECKVFNGWPGILPTSYGRCEVCGKSARCYDVASSRLPDGPIKNAADRPMTRLTREGNPVNEHGSEGHYVITVSLKHVTPKGPGLMGVATERAIEDLLTTTVKADSLPEAVRRAKAVIDVAAAPPAA